MDKQNDRQDADTSTDDNPSADKKERVLHTRVSVEFEDELKRRATQLGTSVSGLVRHTLAQTLAAVQQAMAEPRATAQQEFRVGWVTPAQETTNDRSPVLLGWQELIINLNAVCEECNSILTKGSKAAVAIYEGAGPRQFLCCACLGKIGEK